MSNLPSPCSQLGIQKAQVLWGAGQRTIMLPFQIQESIPHPGSLPRLLQRSQRRWVWVLGSQEPPALGRTHQKNTWRDLRGPDPSSAPIIPPSRLPTSSLPHQPLLQLHTSPSSNSEGCDKAERGLGFVPFLAEIYGTRQGGALNCLRRRGEQFLNSWWLWDCGQPGDLLL